MKKNNFVIFIILIFIISPLLICSKKRDIKENIPITVAHWGHSKILIYLPLYVAIDGGFFKEQGLDAKIKYSGNDDQVFATVLSGDAQFGVGDPAFTAISREKGGPGKVISTLVGGLANWGVAKKGRFKEISSFKQLEGLKISSFPSPSTTFTLLTEIIKNNNLKKTKIIETPFGNELALLEGGEVDLAIMLEPNASIAESRGHEVVFDFAKMYGPFTLTGITTIEEYINENSEIVQKMVNAIQKSLEYCHSNLEETIEIATKNFPDLNKNVVINAVNRMINNEVIPRHAKIDSIAWRKLLEIRYNVGDLKSVEEGFKAIDNSFALKKK